MVNNQEINWNFHGDGYDQQLELSDELGPILYTGNCDNFVATINQEIHLNFNFRAKNVFPHILKKYENMILIMPSLPLLENNVTYPNKYFQTYIVDAELIKNLWVSLRYPPEEIDTLKYPTDDELMLFWFANINQLSLDRPLAIIAANLIPQILGDNPEEYPKVIDIIKLYLSGDISFEAHSLIQVNNALALTTYINTDESILVEWQSLDLIHHNQIILKNNWRIKMIFQAID